MTPKEMNKHYAYCLREENNALDKRGWKKRRTAVCEEVRVGERKKWNIEKEIKQEKSVRVWEKEGETEGVRVERKRRREGGGGGEGGMAAHQS